MKYLTDDGKEFSDLTEAQEWEAKLEAVNSVKSKAISHLGKLGLSGRNLARRVNEIVDWELVRDDVLNRGSQEAPGQRQNPASAPEHP